MPRLTPEVGTKFLSYDTAWLIPAYITSKDAAWSNFEHELAVYSIKMAVTYEKGICIKSSSDAPKTSYSGFPSPFLICVSTPKYHRFQRELIQISRQHFKRVISTRIMAWKLLPFGIFEQVPQEEAASGSAHTKLRAQWRVSVHTTWSADKYSMQYCPAFESPYWSLDWWVSWRTELLASADFATLRKFGQDP